MADARLRKAWSVTSDYWDNAEIVVFSRTRAKALYQLYVDSDASLTFGQYLKRTRIQRDVARDILLPDRHPLAPHIHPQILSAVVHAFGGTGLKAGYRDYYYTSLHDWVLKAAHYHGLFTVHPVDGKIHDRDMAYFILTDLGKNVACGEAETYPRW